MVKGSEAKLSMVFGSGDNQSSLLNDVVASMKKMDAKKDAVVLKSQPRRAFCGQPSVLSGLTGANQEPELNAGNDDPTKHAVRALQIDEMDVFGNVTGNVTELNAFMSNLTASMCNISGMAMVDTGLEDNPNGVKNMYGLIGSHIEAATNYGPAATVVKEALVADEDTPSLNTPIAQSTFIKKASYAGAACALLFKPINDSYYRPPLHFRATIEDITDEPGSFAAIEHRSEKMLLLTWHDSSKPTKEPVSESVTSSFGDVARSGVESYRLSHDESFGVDDLDLNLNELVDLNVFQIKTQYDLPVSQEPYVGRTQEPIVEKVRIQEPITEEVRTYEPIVEEVRTQEPIMEEVRTQEPIVKYVIVEEYILYDDEEIDIPYDTQYDVHFSEDAGTDDHDDDEDEDFLVDEFKVLHRPNDNMGKQIKGCKSGDDTTSLHANEVHANEVRIIRERNQDPLAFVANQEMTPPHFNTY
ncbi:hypothetical protein Tco_0046483 [Tanacetum coccineum]